MTTLIAPPHRIYSASLTPLRSGVKAIWVGSGRELATPAQRSCAQAVGRANAQRPLPTAGSSAQYSGVVMARERC